MIDLFRHITYWDYIITGHLLSCNPKKAFPDEEISQYHQILVVFKRSYTIQSLAKKKTLMPIYCASIRRITTISKHLTAYLRSELMKEKEHS